MKSVVLNLNFRRCSYFSILFAYKLQYAFDHWFMVYFLQLENVINSRNSKISSLEKRINDIVDRIYKKFSESVGVKNIREYEENQLKAVQLMADQKLSLLSQQSKLKYQ